MRSFFGRFSVASERLARRSIAKKVGSHEDRLTSRAFASAQRHTRSNVIAVTVGACLLFPTVFFVSGQAPPSSELDPSWQLLLGYALTHSLEFGREIILTYGPLGFITTRHGLGDLEAPR